MAEDQKTPPPYLDDLSSERNEATASSKRLSGKRIAIIAISGILIVAFILIAILVGMYMFQQTQKDILKFTLELNKETTQETISDPNNNVVQYHVQRPNYDLLVIEDFNRDIQVLKVQESSQTKCLTTPLNRTMSISPEVISELSKNAEDQNDGNISDYVVRYRVSERPISDISFLNKKANTACKDIPTYWLFPYCDGDSASHTSRKRRAVCTQSWCCKKGGLFNLFCKRRCSIAYLC